MMMSRSQAKPRPGAVAQRYAPALLAGLITGAVAVVLQISFASLIFSGSLQGYLSAGIGYTLFGAFVMTLIAGLWSSLPGVICYPQDSPAAILAVMAAAITASLAAQGAADAAFPTVVVAMAAATLLTGLCMVVLGRFRLGNLIRYLPYPVIGGFLAGTGGLLAHGSFAITLGQPLTLGSAPALFQPEMLARWLPAVALGTLLVVVNRRRSNLLLLPALLLGSVLLFYLTLWLLNVSPAEAQARGWLLGPMPSGSLWQPPTLDLLSQAVWPRLLSALVPMGTVAIFGVVGLLLTASALEITAGRDADFNRELLVAGVANLAAGLGASPTGYHSLSQTTFGYRFGAASRVMSMTTCLVIGAMLAFGASLLNYFPTALLGGLVFYLGLSFLVEWLYDAWFRFSHAEYLIVVVIFAVMNVRGVLEGVGLGIAIAVVLFVVDYSRVNVVKHTLTGRTFHSNVDRGQPQRQLLREQGDLIYVLKLQGFLFFGTANALLEQVRARFADKSLPAPYFVLLDFRLVYGLDASAVISFVKMRQFVEAQQGVLVFSQLSPAQQHSLGNDVLHDPEAGRWRIFPDLDHAMEWCEETILARSATSTDVLAGADAPPQAGHAQTLAEFVAVPGLSRYVETLELPAGAYVIREGDAPRGLFFVIEGELTAQMEMSDGRSVRLRRMFAGTTVGELGVYAHVPASASVVASAPTRLAALSTERLAQMEAEDPVTAAAFHRFIAQLLSERLLSSTRTLRALME